LRIKDSFPAALIWTGGNAVGRRTSLVHDPVLLFANGSLAAVGCVTILFFVTSPDRVLSISSFWRVRWSYSINMGDFELWREQVENSKCHQIH
jgi:hypothetical protein